MPHSRTNSNGQETTLDVRSVRGQLFQSRHARPRRGGIAQTVVWSMVILSLLVGGGWYWYQSQDEPVSVQPITVKVKHDAFVSYVLDQGEVQSSENVEIRCEVRQRNDQLVVIDLVPEGSQVTAGDFLVQLKTTTFETELEQQKIALTNIQTEVIQSESILATASASKKEYEQGTYVENRKTIQNEIFDAKSQIQTAQQELNQAMAVLEHSKKLQARSFITRQQLISDEFAVEKAKIAAEKGQNSKELALQKLQVLDDITRAKELVRLDSDIRSAEVQLASRRDALQVEEAKLRTIKRQIERCTVRVPKGVSGQVVYATERNRGDDWVLEKGTTVRENQVMIRLPNPNKMEIKALVNEQSITRVRPNMPVTIQVDALNNRKLTGIVTKVNQYAESGGWMRSSVRKYGVLIQILDPPLSLKPGMNASVSIQTSYQADALLAPLQTVYGVQNQQFCLAKTGENEFTTLEVQVGGDNSEMVMFESGVDEGTELVMNPAAYKDLMDLPEIQRNRQIELPPGAKAAYGRPDAPPKKPTERQPTDHQVDTAKAPATASKVTPAGGTGS